MGVQELRAEPAGVLRPQMGLQELRAGSLQKVLRPKMGLQELQAGSPQEL